LRPGPGLGGSAAGKPGGRATRSGLPKSASRHRRWQEPGKKRGAAASACPDGPGCRSRAPRDRAPRGVQPPPPPPQPPRFDEDFIGSVPMPGHPRKRPLATLIGLYQPEEDGAPLGQRARSPAPGDDAKARHLLELAAASQTIGSSRWLAPSPPAATPTVTLVCAPAGSPAPPRRPMSSQPMFRIHRGCAALQVQAEPTSLRAAAEGSRACVLGRSEQACMLA
jgi:hypothetical protein